MEKIQCQNLILKNVPVAFAASSSSLMSGKKTGKKPLTILNAEENTIEDNVQNGTKKQRIFPNAADPKAPKMTWVHWVLYNIPPNINNLQQAVKSVDLPSGTLEGIKEPDVTDISATAA